MQYEELQAIWETQKQRPVFAVNEFGLHMELNRTRTRTRRRHFWVDVFPLFIVAPILVIPLAVPALVFFLQGSPEHRRRNEKRQKVFAPSLRQEIELGIAQVDFDLSRVTDSREWRVGTACVLAAVILAWEIGRLNSNPLPWKTVWMAFPWLFMMIWMRRSWKQQAVERISKRRQALEALRTKLDE